MAEGAARTTEAPNPDGSVNEQNQPIDSADTTVDQRPRVVEKERRAVPDNTDDSGSPELRPPIAECKRLDRQNRDREGHQISRRTLQMTFYDHQEALNNCMARQYGPPFAFMQFYINADGTVCECVPVHRGGLSEEAIQCLVAVVESMEFPERDVGLSVTYPMTYLTPHDLRFLREGCVTRTECAGGENSSSEPLFEGLESMGNAHPPGATD